MEKKEKEIKCIIIIFLIWFSLFPLSLYLHEYNHYIAFKKYNINCSIHMSWDLSKNICAFNNESDVMAKDNLNISQKTEAYLAGINGDIIIMIIVSAIIFFLIIILLFNNDNKIKLIILFLILFIIIYLFILRNNIIKPNSDVIKLVLNN